MMRALTKYLAGLVLVGALLFWPAGDIRWWNGRLFTAILFGPMLLLGIVLLIKSPALLEKRLNAKEKQSAQKGVVAVAALLFAGVFVLAGLDYRFGWSGMPRGVSDAAAVVQLLAYGLYAEVMRENAYLSRTVEVQQGQKVVDTGLYGIVRHPMYAATILLFLAMPLVLGSWPAFALMLLYPPAIAVRIRDEERLLREELAGYDAYLKKVKYRIIPFIW
jgi:protein-S-isoprenylcysteine O-methyltransferase Ste14